MIPVNRPKIGKLEVSYVNNAIKSGWISSEGPFVNKFEFEVSRKFDRKFGVAVSNGTVALEMAVIALGIGKGDEVIIPNFTIISCALAVIKAGATPVFVDCDKDSWNINVDLIESKITNKTKAILIAHIYGLPVDMDQVMKLSRKYNLKIIEDAAEAHGQLYKSKPCGSFGNISILSFYANKHITTGEGGMILTNSPSIYKECYNLRNLYFSKTIRYKHNKIGMNARLTNLQAALGLAQLHNLNKTISIKKRLGNLYQEQLTNIENLQLPLKEFKGCENHYWVFGVVVKNTSSQKVKRIIEKLSQNKIQTRSFFFPMHLQPILKNNLRKNQNKFPVSEYISSHGFYLPSGVGTTRKEVEYVCKILKRILIEEKL